MVRAKPGHFSRTIAKGLDTTTRISRIWDIDAAFDFDSYTSDVKENTTTCICNIHADAHDFDSYTSDVKEICDYLGQNTTTCIWNIHVSDTSGVKKICDYLGQNTTTCIWNIHVDTSDTSDVEKICDYLSQLFNILLPEHSAEGQSSGTQETGGGRGVGGAQQGPPTPPVQQHPPQQQGGSQGGGRGWGPQQRGGYGGRGGGGAPRGGMPPQHYQSGPPEYQQGRGQQYQRGGATGQRQRGGIAHGVPLTGGPSRPPIPELHQATQVYQPGVTSQSMPYGSPVESQGEASSSSRAPEHSQLPVTQPFQQLSLQPEVSPSQGIQPASSKSMRFPLRPGKGSTGTKCVVKANHFFAELPDKDLHQYDVSITPKVTSRGVNRAVMEQLVRLYRASEEAVGRYCPVCRSFYALDLGRRQPLGEGLESWREFYQRIRPTQMGLSLNIDMSSTAFIEPLPVVEFVNQLLNRDVSSRPLSDADRVKIKKALRGVKVEVTHRGNMRRKYRISGLTSQATRELTFPVDERGTMKSVVEYFQETYGFVIHHTQLPCLQVGNQQRPNYLPMEVCKIVEGQRYSKRLNERQITALLKVTCQRPQEGERDILQTVRHNAYAEDPYAKEFGIKISERLAQVEARILPAPWLKHHDSGREKDCLPQVGQWNMMNKKMVNGGTVSNWICINFSRNVQDSVVRSFCQELAQMCITSGMNFHPHPVLAPTSARPDQVERALKAKYHDAMTQLPPQRKELDLLIVILPDNNGSLYGDLKRICETDLGIVSQCCLTKHVFKMSKQYLANVALKINVKVGGRNTVLVDALSRRIPLVSDRPTIIFGADVTHPHPGEDSSPSIAAVVASQDWPEVTKYAGLVSAQAHRQELIQDLFKTWQDPTRGTVTGGMIKELLISFRKATEQKPQRIIFYRDGVSEGQFYQVLRYELDAIRRACASLESNYHPPVTFVVVQKRHHTRLFANNHHDRNAVDRSGNILPGTVVDSKICHPTEFDFYLCSHAEIQGTSRPAHYHVLWDENNFSADGLQSLTNNLCCTYVTTYICQELAQMCITSGMNFHPHPVLAPTSARPDQVERALKAKYHDAMTQLPPQRKELDLLIVILPDNNGSLYGFELDVSTNLWSKASYTIWIKCSSRHTTNAY